MSTTCNMKWGIISNVIVTCFEAIGAFMTTFFKNHFFLLMSLFLVTLTVLGKDEDAEKTETEINADAHKTLPKLLDLGAHKCIPCKKMAPILTELTTEYPGVFDVEFIDVWQPENKEKAKAHKIKSIPTQIFFDENGKELWRHVGFFSKKDILKKWKELGFSFKAVKTKTDQKKSASAKSE